MRALFAGWLPEAIELYLLDGMREGADGSLELKCPGAVEAAVFSGSWSIDVFALARAVSCPTLFQWAEGGDFPLPLYEMVASSMPDARVERIACGHLVPMERPDLVVDAVKRFAAA